MPQSFVSVVGQDTMELVAGGGGELGDDLGQVILDGAGLTNSRAAISGLNRPSPAGQVIWVSRTVSRAVPPMRSRLPVASSSRAISSANPPTPMAANIWCRRASMHRLSP